MVFDLRYYQEEALESVHEVWQKHQAAVVVAATGLGKTECYLHAAVSHPGRVLVIGHRDYLISQPIARLAAHGFDDVSVEMANERSELHFSRAKIVFGSIQSLCKPKRLATFDPLQFSLVIVDEGHRAVAKTYRTVIDHFRQNARCRFLILTATPKRKDNIALGNLCDGDISVAYSYGPKQAAQDGWLVPLRFFRREVPDLDFRNVDLKGSDLNPDQVESLLLEEKPLHKVCASLAEDRGPTIVFCPGVKVAQAYSALMNSRYRKGRATVLWADSLDEEREDAGKKLASGDLDYIFNVDLFTEGFDVPDLVRVVWAAPTASLVRFTQGTGRVFRPHASLRGKLTGGRENAAERRALIESSPKPVGQVVTYYPQNCKHQLCEPNDILGGEDLPPDVREAAKAIQELTAKTVGGSAPEEDVETAEAFIELRKLLERRRQRVKAQAKVEDVQYDGFGGSANRLSGEDVGEAKAAAKKVSTDWKPGNPATEKQISWFRWKKIAIPEGFTKHRACVVRDLIEMGVNPETAMSYGYRQAMAVSNKMKAQAASTTGGNDEWN